MGKRLFDTSVLIQHWHQRIHSRTSVTSAHASEWADELVALYGTNTIVTPVLIEFLAGTQSSEELKLARAYLSRFDVVDRQQIPRRDWEEAQRLAQRVRRDGRPRQLGDCLIRAIANRLHFDVITRDQGFV